MPHRLICIAILLFWTVAAGSLFTRDVLPDYLLGPPPDLRSITQADQPTGPSKWSILAMDDNAKSPSPRSVGQVVTEVQKKRDGWVRMTSTAWLDSGELLRGTAFESSATVGDRLGMMGSCEIDSTGNLQSFRMVVRLESWGPQALLTIEGRIKKEELEDRLEVISRSPIPMLNLTKTLPYQPRGIVQNALGPLDRIPGLQVGQTWKSQVVSPWTGMVQDCFAEVVGTETVFWGKSPVTTYKVVTRMLPISAATWVRPDGLVLRQEVPTPFATKIVMERIADDPAEGGTPASGGKGRGRR